MTGRMARNKGARGEREARDLLTQWAGPVYESAGQVSPVIRRNLMQSREGGYDLVGIDWLALEVKRQEGGSLPAWWRQTVGNAAAGQVPFLMWRRNRQPWQFRVRMTVAYGCVHQAWVIGEIDADLTREAAQDWFQRELFQRLTNGEMAHGEA